MNELNDEIKLTLNLMQSDIDDGAHGALQGHLYILLEIKRNELHQRLVERSWAKPVTHDQEPIKRGQLADRAEPLAAEELKAGGWWLAETGDGALKAFLSLGFKTEGDIPWDGSYYACFIFESGSDLIDRGNEQHTFGLKQIHRVGNEFYWGDA